MSPVHVGMVNVNFDPDLLFKVIRPNLVITTQINEYL